MFAAERAAWATWGREGGDAMEEEERQEMKRTGSSG